MQKNTMAPPRSGCFISNSDKIKDICGMSKSSFKKAVGRLLKNEKVKFEGNGIKLI